MMPVGIHAAPIAHVILQKEPAALEIPTLGVAGVLLLPQPEVNDGFLSQIVVQCAINRQIEYDPSQHYVCFVLID